MLNCQNVSFDEKVQFLGYVISTQGILVDLAKVGA